MCPLCPCSGTTAQYGGGGGACVPYLPVVVLQHSMEEEEHEPSAAGACQCDSRSCVVSTTSQLLCGYKGFVVYFKMKTTFYCIGCSDLENDYLFSYCGFGTSRDCYIQHLTKMGFGS